MDRIPELTKLERTKSTMRYRPPNGTAGFARSAVSGCKRSPLPPARTIPKTSIVAPFFFASLRQQLLIQIAICLCRALPGEVPAHRSAPKSRPCLFFSKNLHCPAQGHQKGLGFIRAEDEAASSSESVDFDWLMELLLLSNTR